MQAAQQPLQRDVTGRCPIMQLLQDHRSRDKPALGGVTLGQVNSHPKSEHPENADSGLRFFGAKSSQDGQGRGNEKLLRGGIQGILDKSGDRCLYAFHLFTHSVDR